MTDNQKKELKVNEGAVIRKPGSALENKTGSWRTFKPVSVAGKCTGCGMCALFCPEHCIKIVGDARKKHTVINYDYCKGCLICINECPVKAMKAEKEK